MLNIDRIRTIQGHLTNGFFVRDGAGKVLAIGAVQTPTSDGFVLVKAKRYARNVQLCQAIANLTKLPVKWNINPFIGRSEYEMRRYWQQVSADRARQKPQRRHHENR